MDGLVQGRIATILAKDLKLTQNWREFPIYLNYDDPSLLQLQDSYSHGSLRAYDVFRQILAGWASKTGSAATISKLVEILLANEYTTSAENIAKEYKLPLPLVNTTEESGGAQNQQGAAIGNDSRGLNYQGLTGESILLVFRDMTYQLVNKMSDDDADDLKLFAVTERIISQKEYKNSKKLEELISIIGNRTSDQVKKVLEFLYNMEANQAVRNIIVECITRRARN